jgi:hypothetical protein
MAHIDPKPDTEALDTAWRKERVAILERNDKNANYYEGHLPELRRRKAKRRTLIVCCLDERSALLEEALGLIPGEARVFSSYGGRFNPYDLQELFGEDLRRWQETQVKMVFCLVAHSCSGHPELGCYAFNSDLAAQVAYLTERKQQLVTRFPQAFVHVLMLDTASNQLMPADLDESDDAMADLLAEQVNRDRWTPGSLKNSGYGIYVGDSYLAWVDAENKYSRLPSRHPNLGQEMESALQVILDHSTVDLGKQPIIVHCDFPIYEDVKLTGKARRSIEVGLEHINALPMVQRLRETGQLRIMRTELEMGTHRGMDVS